jgi:hypothetical protein
MSEGRKGVAWRQAALLLVLLALAGCMFNSEPTQAQLEQRVAQDLGRQHNTTATVSLTKDGPHSYSGTATLANGMRMKVTVTVNGAVTSWQAVSMP